MPYDSGTQAWTYFKVVWTINTSIASTLGPSIDPGIPSDCVTPSGRDLKAIPFATASHSMPAVRALRSANTTVTALASGSKGGTVASGTDHVNFVYLPVCRGKSLGKTASRATAKVDGISLSFVSAEAAVSTGPLEVTKIGQPQ
jgi:hypothetical protein